VSIFDRVKVGVAPVRHMRGVANLATLYPERGEPFGLNNKGKEAKGALKTVTLGEMIDHEFDREPHFAFYTIVDEDGEPLDRFPRIQKVALGQVREMNHDVECWGGGIDFDLKDYAPFQTDASIKKGDRGKITWDVLNADQRQHVIDLLNQVGEHLSEVGMPWNYCHASNGGVHFIHVFPMPVPAGVPFERLMGQIRDAYVEAGLPVDASCKDWTRLFKCPRVTIGGDQEDEDGVQVWDTDWFWEETQEEEFTIPSEEDFEPDAGDNLVIVASSMDFERPDPETARGLVEELTDGGKMRLTEAGKEARKALNEADCDYMGAIFHQEFPITEENRHTTITAAVGQVIAAIHGYKWATAELVYGLLYPAAADLGIDDSGLPFVDQLWENCTTFWGREESKAEARRAQAMEKKREDEERVASQDPARPPNIDSRVIDQGLDSTPGDTSAPPIVDACEFDDNVKLWLPDAEGRTHEEITALIKDRKLGILIDQKRDNCHVLLPNGFYESDPCSSNMVRKVIEERGMEWVVPTGYWKEDDQGRQIKVPYKTPKIIDEHARTYATCDFTLRHGGSHLRVGENGRGILNLVPFGLRRDLIESRKVFDECVEWLTLCVEDRMSENWLKAIAYLAAIYWGPTAAVALIGRRGVGKSMLGEALADMVTTRRVVPGDVVLMKHNDALLWSPFIHIDEGLKKGGDGIDFGDIFRRIVAGGPVPLEPKNMPMMRCAGIHRMLITANNTDTLIRIAGTRARNEEDWEAIAERIAVFRAQDRAAEFLQVHGGLDFTRSWCGPGSEFKLARTILALLYDELEWEDGRPLRMGTRFLYEGNANESLIQDMQAEAQGVPEILRAIHRALDRKGEKSAVIENGVLYILSEKIIEIADENSPQTSQELRSTLRSMLRSDQQERMTVNGRQARWRSIDLERFRVLSERIGVAPSRAATPKLRSTPVDGETTDILKKRLK